MRTAVVVSLLAVGLACPHAAFGGSYLLVDHWGGTVADAEKSPTNTEDDLMCWAAAASNVLEWTGWGQVLGMTTTDEMFQYFQAHWTDEGGLMEYGWNWWFDGVNRKQGQADWSQVDVPGGGFFPSETFSDYFARSGDPADAMAFVDAALHAGYGTALGIYRADPKGGHAVTCWGYDYDDGQGGYVAIYITDSDDDKTQSNPTDRLRRYEVALTSGLWHLQDYGGGDAWYIGTAQALGPRPIPEPLTVLGVVLGLCGVGGYVRRRRAA